MNVTELLHATTWEGENESGSSFGGESIEDEEEAAPRGPESTRKPATVVKAESLNVANDQRTTSGTPAVKPSVTIGETSKAKNKKALRQQAPAGRPEGVSDEDMTAEDADGKKGASGASKSRRRSSSSTVTNDPYVQRQLIKKVMGRVLPHDSHISSEAVDLIQECVTELIYFLMGESLSNYLDRDSRARERRGIQGEDILKALDDLGFDGYGAVLDVYYEKVRAVYDRKRKSSGGKTTVV